MPSRRALLGIFFLSGASALVYQVIWARQLGLVFGNTTTSISIVLAAFMAGLALGAGLAGHWLPRLTSPLRSYALVEGGIAVYALAFSPLVGAIESLYPMLFSDETGAAVLIAFRALFAFVLLLIPTTLMGATLPLLSEAFHRAGIHPEDWNAGRLYSANTLGAAVGSVASGFLGIELLGIQATTVLAALGNVAVMGIGLWLARRMPGAASRTDSLPSSTRDSRRLLLFFAGVGALALAGEVLWTRALTFLLGSSTYAFSSILITYLVGIALGSWLLAGRVRSIERPERLLVPLVLGAGLWHLLAVRAVDPLHALAVQLRFATGGLSDGQLSVAVAFTFGLLLLLMLPPALFSGALFPVVTRLLGGESGDRGGPIARAYTWNTVGAVAGSLGAGFVIAPNFVQLPAIQLLALGFAGLAGFAALALRSSQLAPRDALLTAVSIAAVAGLSALALARPDPLLHILQARSGDEIVVPFHEPGIQGTVTVRHPRGQARRWSQLLVNGVGMTVKAWETKAMAHLPLMVHGAAEDSLVVAFGFGTSYRSALSHGGRVDVVELMPEVFTAFDFFYPDAAAVRANPRGRMIVNDGRNFLLLTRKRYDVITVDPPPPIDSAGVNNLYSREFIALMREHLKPGGIAAHWVPSHNSVGSGVPDPWTRDMLLCTFVEAFPYVRALDGDPLGTHLLGSLEPFDLDPAKLGVALAKPAVLRDVNEYPWDRFRRDRVFNEIPLPDCSGQGSPVLTDDRPRLEFNLIRNARRGLLHRMLRVFL